MRTQVKSSQIVAIEREPTGAMIVEFHPRKGAPPDTVGARYRYTGPQVAEHYNGLIGQHTAQEAGNEDASVGSFFINSVKPHYTKEGESKFERLEA